MKATPMGVGGVRINREQKRQEKRFTRHIERSSECSWIGAERVHYRDSGIHITCDWTQTPQWPLRPGAMMEPRKKERHWLSGPLKTGRSSLGRSGINAHSKSPVARVVSAWAKLSKESTDLTVDVPRTIVCDPDAGVTPAAAFHRSVSVAKNLMGTCRDREILRSLRFPIKTFYCSTW